MHELEQNLSDILAAYFRCDEFENDKFESNKFILRV